MNFLKRITGWFRNLFTRRAKIRTRGYSGDKSRPHVIREPRYLHVSKTGSERGITYYRPELRRHELRKLKKAGLDLTGTTGTRQFEGLL